jgi:SAM-dependent methyltransferase
VARLPELNDPRFLHEVGWFLYHSTYVFPGDSYRGERLERSGELLAEVLEHCVEDSAWLEGKTVVSVGAGCTGDLAAWPAAVKVALDPLMYAYQQLGMLVEDAPGTASTLYLSLAGEDLPLLDGCADVVLCRNALDHMPDPEAGLAEMERILRDGGLLFLSVDLGGEPTPDEPSPFEREDLRELVAPLFDEVSRTEKDRPHSPHRDSSVRLLLRKRGRLVQSLDRDVALRDYLRLLRDEGCTHAWDEEQLARLEESTRAR